MEIEIGKKVLEANDSAAQENRRLFAKHSVFVVNLMSSPGSGKTTILEKTLARIAPEISSAVIVGDICTSNDADRLDKTGVPVVQINTEAFGGDCHLAAELVGNSAKRFDLERTELLIVENVGNLVCPAEFDIGEDTRVVVLSVAEGEDKPLKYPLMFRVCEAALLNKVDLLPYLDYDRDSAVENMKKINSNLAIFEISARTEAGFDAWRKWLKANVQQKKRP